MFDHEGEPRGPEEETPQEEVKEEAPVFKQEERGNFETSERMKNEEAEEIERLRQEIQGEDTEQFPKAEEPADRAQKIKEYQEKYLPSHLRKRSFVSEALTRLWVKMSGKLEKDGQENIPDKGPFIVVGNH